MARVIVPKVCGVVCAKDTRDCTKSTRDCNPTQRNVDGGQIDGRMDG
jgi:hypothetical protein